MIKIRIKNGDHEIDIRFPISESELYAKLAEVHAIEGRDAPQSAFVTEVYWPEEFFMLKDRFANLDELNYLARRMESFDYNESADELLKDNIENTIKVANHEFASLIADCSEYEKRILLSILNTAKAAMRENRHLLISRR